MSLFNYLDSCDCINYDNDYTCRIFNLLYKFITQSIYLQLKYIDYIKHYCKMCIVRDNIRNNYE